MICTSKDNYGEGNNHYLTIGEKYVVDDVSTKRNSVTLKEFPQINKSDKFKWFHIDNFQIINDSEMSERLNLDLIQIDGKEWTREFCSIRKFRSGKSIPVASNMEDWLEHCRAEQPVMCFYGFDPNNHALYNYYAINNKEVFAPEGFRFPRDEDEGCINKLFKNTKLPNGILMAGCDPQSGHFRKEFKDDQAVWQDADQESVSSWNEIITGEEKKDLIIGGYIFEMSMNHVESSNVNGFFGYPVVLVSNRRVNIDSKITSLNQGNSDGKINDPTSAPKSNSSTDAISELEVQVMINTVNGMLKSFRGDRKKWALQYKDHELFYIVSGILNGKIRNNEMKSAVVRHLQKTKK